MGFRYRKSINLGSGVRLNVGKKGIGMSAGVKGLRVSRGADGKTRVTASIPGTGISYQESIGDNKKKENKKIQESPARKRIDEHELLFSFQGTLQAIHEGGRLVIDDFNRYLYNGNFTVSFYIGSVHMDDPNRGKQTNYTFVGDIPIRKSTYETGFWVFKGTRTNLIFEINSVEYTFHVQSEAVADEVIAWHTKFVEDWKALKFYDIEVDEEEKHLLTNGWDEEDWEEDFSYPLSDDEPLLMSCIHCYTRDEVQDWQMSIDEETNNTKIYCRHCLREYDTQESIQWELQFLNEEGKYAFNSMTCGNCDEDISLIGVPFEDGVAFVTCLNCNVEIRFTTPS